MPRRSKPPRSRARPTLRVIEGEAFPALPSLASLQVELDVLTGLVPADLSLAGRTPGSAALAAALDAVAAAEPSELVVVPREPEPEMLEAATADAGVDAFTAARVWRAMVRVAE
jgi:hypothetical protein